MTDIIKYTKIDLINSIKIYYLKQGLLCENINKLSKEKLITIMIDNNIQYINNETLKIEIIMTENYNKNKDTIY